MSESDVSCGTTTRDLDRKEAIYASNPRGMAGHHWAENGENHNPYKPKSHDWNQYENAFADLLAREDQSV